MKDFVNLDQMKSSVLQIIAWVFFIISQQLVVLGQTTPTTTTVPTTTAPTSTTIPLDENKRGAMIDNIKDVLFESRAKPIRDKQKQFEDLFGVKLQYQVDDASLDKIGGLSEYLFKLYQTFTSPYNTNVKTITGEFSTVEFGVPISTVGYKTLATPDLRTCRLPVVDTETLDAMFSRAMGTQIALSPEILAECPENIDGVLNDALRRYENVLIKNRACPGTLGMNANDYNQEVINTIPQRKSNWLTDSTSINATLHLNIGLITSNAPPTPPNGNNNYGNTGVNLGIPLQTLNLPGKYVIDLNNCFNACTENDLEVRCRMLKSLSSNNTHYIFLTKELNYYLPMDSLNKFRDAVVHGIETNHPNKQLVIALYIKMKGQLKDSRTLLVKQLGGTPLTAADISFAGYNNGGNYQTGAYWTFNNLFKNIPKPLTLCYQVAKVNGVLTTTYFKKGEVKGREQLYYHVFKMDKAFDEIRELKSQLSAIYANYPVSPTTMASAPMSGNDYGRIEELRAKVKLAYIKALRTPDLKTVDVNFKEKYLQNEVTAKEGALNHLKTNYSSVIDGSAIGNYSVPPDLKMGTCPSNESTDIIADVLNISSLILSPVGLDFIPDALSVVYYYETGQTADAIIAAGCLAVTGLPTGALLGTKKVVTSSADIIDGVNKGGKLIKDGGNVVSIVKADNESVLAICNLKPFSEAPAALINKLDANPNQVQLLLNVTEAQAKMYSHVNDLPTSKKIEFINKVIDEPSFFNSIKAVPKRVKIWAGEFTNWIASNTKVAKLGAAVNKIYNFTGFAAKSGDEFIDIIIHYSNGQFVIAQEGGLTQVVSLNQLATIIDGVQNGKTARLLSCNDLSVAKELSLLTEKPFYASDGWVELAKNGDVYSEKAFVKLENGLEKGTLSHNVGGASGAEGTDFVRLGVKNGENFVEYTKNGFKINPSTLDDGFKHIDDFVPNGAGNPTFNAEKLVGCHNETNFNKLLTSNGGRVEIVNITPTGINGVKNIEYRTLQLDIQGNPIPGQYVSNGKTHVKTVYDSAVYPEATMKELGYKSYKDAMDKNSFDVKDPLTNLEIPRSFQGSANGRTILGHYKTVNGENIISSWWIIQ